MDTNDFRNSSINPKDEINNKTETIEINTLTIEQLGKSRDNTTHINNDELLELGHSESFTTLAKGVGF